MQPNKYLQPNTYYQVQAPQKPAKTKSTGGLIAIIILLVVLLLGLGIFVLVDKLILSKKTVVETNDLNGTSQSISLSNVEIPEGSDADILKNVLAGRTFLVNEIYDQYITFKNNSEYTYSYYRTPDQVLDHFQNVPSEHNGTFTVNDKVITLSGGDTFTITGDYLVKTSDKLSSNKNTIYFDANQLTIFKKSLTNAVSSYMNGLQKKATDALATQKSVVNSYTCTYDRPHMTNADSFVCSSTYTLYFSAKDVEKAAEEGKAFTSLCPTLAEAYGATNYVDACVVNSENVGALQTWSNLIVRIKSATNYELTGSYRSEAEASEIVEDEDKKNDDETEEKSEDKTQEE